MIHTGNEDSYDTEFRPKYGYESSNVGISKLYSISFISSGTTSKRMIQFIIEYIHFNTLKYE
jgi:hypothetical protein